MAKVPPFPMRSRARIWPGQIPGTHEPGFEEPELIEHRPPEQMRKLLHRLEVLHTFHFGECNVILSRETPTDDRLRWHISISHPHRHPTWDEIKTVRYRLGGPDLVFAMVLPEPLNYVNVPSQDHVFQLWELVGEEARGW